MSCAEVDVGFSTSVEFNRTRFDRPSLGMYGLTAGRENVTSGRASGSISRLEPRYEFCAALHVTWWASIIQADQRTLDRELHDVHPIA